MTTGRYAPSPTGDLHVGNLRTAVIAWLGARAAGGRFIIRIDDLDRERSKEQYVDRQLADLARLGITHDGETVRQSERDAAYRSALSTLTHVGATFECFCTRAEIRDAQSAPHGPRGRYPGTCRELSDAERTRRRRDRTPSVRLRGDSLTRSWHDRVLGAQDGLVDDATLMRFDGAIAYNLAVVVDDTWQGVTTVVRGDDLADSTATQILLLELLGAAVPEYTHVPLVLASDGTRLAKRSGAATLRDLMQIGWDVEDLRDWIIASLHPALGEITACTAGLQQYADRFQIAALPAAPVLWDGDKHADLRA